jgi:acetylornithine/N-succinyldiaminopimelate aminotransferase
MSHLMRTIEFRKRKIVAGDGAYLIDEDGNQLLDFHSDTGASGLGYNHPAGRAALQTILDRGLPIHSINLYPFAEREETAERLCDATGMDSVFFCNSGTEAVEACIKLARLNKYPENRHEIWSLKKGFHGRTYASMIATDGPPYHTKGFGPHLQGFYKWDFDHIGAINPHAAAVLMSPVLGHHDVMPYTREQLQSIRDYCDEHGILLIFDEVQSGSGRTGAHLYAQKIGVMPDIVALGKGIACGFPAAACLARGDAADTFTPGTHYSTFGGSPSSCVFVNAMLDYLTPEFLASVDDRGKFARKEMRKLGWFREVIGEGLMIAGYSDVDAREFAKRCEKENLIIGAWRENPIRVSPVLDITYVAILEGIETMDRVHWEMTR